MPGLKLQCPSRPRGQLLHSPGAELGLEQHQQPQVCTGSAGALPTFCQETHGVGVDASPLLGPGSAWVYSVPFHTLCLCRCPVSVLGYPGFLFSLLP